MRDYTTLYVGLDIHKETIVAVAMHEESGETLGRKKFSNSPVKLKAYLKSLEKKYQARIEVCYEAGCMGYTLQRAIGAWGYTCRIAAPSLIPQKPGDKRKTDKRDAEKLALYYLTNQLTFIAVPHKTDEPVRDVLRYRDVLRKEILMAKHYILKFLLRKGLRYEKKTHWTQEHWKWLRNLQFPSELDQELFQEYLTLLVFEMQRQQENDRRIDELSRMPRYAEKVRVLRAYRGIDTYSAMVLILETGDFNRFPKAGNYMAYLGLVPSERSSGTRERRGNITKTGNAHCRHVLVQAAWHYARPARIENLASKLSAMPPWVSSQVIQAQKRLQFKYWKIARRSSPQIAAVAVARELAGFIWGTMRTLEEKKSEKKAA